MNSLLEMVKEQKTMLRITDRNYFLLLLLLYYYKLDASTLQLQLQE